MTNLSSLVEDVWARWETYFRQPHVPAPSSQPARTVYANGPRFSLTDWGVALVAAGGRTSSEPIPHVNNYVYELDSSGRPLTVRHSHRVNDVDWHGAYRYGPSEIELVELCLQTRVPSIYDRVTLVDALPVTRQSVRINGAGSFPMWRSMPREKVRESIRTESRNFQCFVEQYEIAEGRYISGEGVREGLGTPLRHWTLSFTCSPTGRLERVVQRWDTGEETTAFAAKSSTTVAKLSSTLAHRIADRVIEALNTMRLGSPLVAIELAYRVADRYLPTAIAYTVEDNIEGFPVLHPVASDRVIELTAAEFEPEMAELMGRMSSKDDWTIGTKMLRHAARLLSKADGLRAPVLESFCAFAIDWELEGDDFDQIVKECRKVPN
jgi:hypothetical protein